MDEKNNWKIRHYLKPGDIGYLTYIHGIYYAKEYGYDQTFKHMLPKDLLNLFSFITLIAIKFGLWRKKTKSLVLLLLLDIQN